MRVLDEPIEGEDYTADSVREGDAIVAFSNKDIFAIRREIESNKKFKCCVVYGALPPETRANQARLFNDPDSGYDILIASDAIGMGLNLNIRRVIFHTIYKSDGSRIIRLGHSSLKQIAGRAGRRNSEYNFGEVTSRVKADLPYIKEQMGKDIGMISHAGLMPNVEHYEVSEASKGIKWLVLINSTVA